MPVRRTPKRVVIHPIVLLSVVDHFTRLSKIGNPGRVVGVLLGSWKKGDIVDVATSFAGVFINYLEYVSCYIIIMIYK